MIAICEKKNNEVRFEVIDRLILDLKSYTTEKVRPCSMTIKDFSGLKNACKLEIMLEGKCAIVTASSGDVEGTLGWKKHALIGNDLLKLLKIDSSISDKAFKDLSQNGWAVKYNTFKGQDGKLITTVSVLLWRDVGKAVVEQIFRL